MAIQGHILLIALASVGLVSTGCQGGPCEFAGEMCSGAWGPSPGSGGPVPPPFLPATPPLEIVDELVPVGSNDFGIEGAFLPVNDDFGSEIQIASSNGAICMAGRVAAVENDAFGDYWGAATFLQLSNGQPWDKGDGEVLGFSFSLVGPLIPPSLRLLATPASEAADLGVFCSNLVPFEGLEQNVLFEDVTLNCWAPGGDELSGDLSSVAWHIPSDPGISHDFDFCVQDIRPIVH